MTPSNPRLPAPLLTDDDVLDEVGLLVGTALRDQLWLIYLDECSRRLHTVVQVDLGELVRPLPEALWETVASAEASAVVVAYERCGPDTLDAEDVSWLRAVVDGARAARIALRGPVLVHDRGPRPVAPDDLV